MGSLRYAILYVVAALGGGIAGMLWHSPLAPLVGGSGALFGMFGAAVAVVMREGRGQLDFLDHHGGRRLIGLIGINLVLGFLIPVVSNAGHIGGLVAGFVCTYLFLDRGRAGTDTITRVSALELGPHGIRVNAVNPTVVMTEMSAFYWGRPEIGGPFLAQMPLGRWATEDDIAAPIAFLLSDGAAMISGVSLPIDGGFTAC